MVRLLHVSPAQVRQRGSAMHSDPIESNATVSGRVWERGRGPGGAGGEDSGGAGGSGGGGDGTGEGTGDGGGPPDCLTVGCTVMVSPDQPDPDGKGDGVGGGDADEGGDTCF